MFKKSFILILMMTFVSTSALAGTAKKADKLAKALKCRMADLMPDAESDPAA